MSSITLQLDPVAIREATSQAIMGLLTPEMKTKIITDALSNLLKPSTDSWRNNKTPLEEAFNNAVIQVTQKMAKEMVEGDADLVAKIKDLINQTAHKVLNTDVEKLAGKMSDSFISSMRRD